MYNYSQELFYYIQNQLSSKYTNIHITYINNNPDNISKEFLATIDNIQVYFSLPIDYLYTEGISITNAFTNCANYTRLALVLGLLEILSKNIPININSYSLVPYIDSNGIFQLNSDYLLQDSGLSVGLLVRASANSIDLLSNENLMSRIYINTIAYGNDTTISYDNTKVLLESVLYNVIKISIRDIDIPNPITTLLVLEAKSTILAPKEASEKVLLKAYMFDNNSPLKSNNITIVNYI